MRSFFNFVFGLMSGALVGAVAALLLAPSSGDQLRSGVMNRYEGTLSNLRSAVEQERHKLEEELDSLKRGEIQLS
jgi:gas vesicle protein